MASYTTNLNLKKPAGSENVAIGDINNNMDTIDQAFGTLNSKTTVNIEDNKIKFAKRAGIVTCVIDGEFTAAAWGNIGTIPQGYRPSISISIPVTNGRVILQNNGNIATSEALNNTTIIRHATYVCD